MSGSWSPPCQRITTGTSVGSGVLTIEPLQVLKYYFSGTPGDFVGRIITLEGASDTTDASEVTLIVLDTDWNSNLNYATISGDNAEWTMTTEYWPEADIGSILVLTFTNWSEDTITFTGLVSPR